MSENDEFLDRIIKWVIIPMFIIMFIIMFAFMIDVVTDETMRIEKTECYDRFGNEIEGLVCEDKIKCGIISKLIDKKYCYGDDLK